MYKIWEFLLKIILVLAIILAIIVVGIVFMLLLDLLLYGLDELATGNFLGLIPIFCVAGIMAYLVTGRE